ASTLMTTPSAAGFGSGTVWIVGASPNFSKTTALIGHTPTLLRCRKTIADSQLGQAEIDSARTGRRRYASADEALFSIDLVLGRRLLESRQRHARGVDASDRRIG